MISSWLAVAFVVCSAVIFLVRLPFNFPRTWQQLFTLFYDSLQIPAAIMAFMMIAGAMAEPVLWRTPFYPAWLAHSVTLERPGSVGGSILMDAATAEHLCGKPAPEPDVSQKSSGLYVRCESPFIYERGVYRVIWKN